MRIFKLISKKKKLSTAVMLAVFLSWYVFMYHYTSWIWWINPLAQVIVPLLSISLMAIPVIFWIVWTIIAVIKSGDIKTFKPLSKGNIHFTAIMVVLIFLFWGMAIHYFPLARGFFVSFASVIIFLLSIYILFALMAILNIFWIANVVKSIVLWARICKNKRSADK